MSCSHFALMAMAENNSSGNGFAVILCVFAVVASVALNILLLNRIRDFKEDNTEENFLAVKKMRNASGFGGLLILIWCLGVYAFTEFGFMEFDFSIGMCMVFCFLAFLFFTYCIKKYDQVKKIRSADILKQAKGNPSAILSEDIDLSEEEKIIVSQIALKAGVDTGAGYKSDEELFGDAKDPNAASEDNEGNNNNTDNGENANSICPFCGKTNKSEYKICAYCGKVLPVPDFPDKAAEN